MKVISTFLTAPLIMGLGVFVSVLTSAKLEGYIFFQWCLALLGILLIALILGTILNLTIFAPVYWFLGRQQSKRMKTSTKHTTRPGL
jgi:hypothetical protein